MTASPARLLKQAVAARGRGRVRASGGSMAPTVVPGDVVEVVRYPFDDLIPGQVIAFEQDGRVVVHRVRYLGASTVITAGDANLLCDPAVTPEQYIGLAVGCQRGGQEPVPLSALPARPQPGARSGETAPLVWLPWRLWALWRNAPGSARVRPLPDGEPPGEITPRSAIGVSARGLLDETALARAVAQGVHMAVCCADFGPEGGPWVPASRVRGVVRLRVFDRFPEPATAEQLALVVGYLEGLWALAGAAAGREGGQVYG